MKTKFRMSKRILAVFLSVLMIMSAVPMTIFEASAATQTTKVNPNFYTTLSAGNRGGADRVEICSDGASNNTSLGSIKFSTSVIPDNATVTLRIWVKAANGKNNNAKMNIYGADKNVTRPDTATQEQVFSMRFSAVRLLRTVPQTLIMQEIISARIGRIMQR